MEGATNMRVVIIFLANKKKNDLQSGSLHDKGIFTKHFTPRHILLGSALTDRQKKNIYLISNSYALGVWEIIV